MFLRLTKVIMTGSRVPIPSKVFQYVYTVAFTVEILFRLVAEWQGGWTCQGEDRAWNLFDLFIVIVAWFEASLGRLGLGPLGHLILCGVLCFLYDPLEIESLRHLLAPTL